MTIRAAEIGDCQTIGTLSLELLAAERSHYPEMGEAAPWAGSAKEIRRQMRLPGVRFFVAERGGETIGYVKAVAYGAASSRPNLPERIARAAFNLVWRRPRPNVVNAGGHIPGIYVRQSERRSGAGRLLLDAAEEWLRFEGMQSCTIHVIAANREALTFWEECGYQPLVIGMQKQM